MALRQFISRIIHDSQKIVIVGIDFGTSYTKVYFNQGGRIKRPLKFSVSGHDSYFLPTELFYDSKFNTVYFSKQKDTESLKYFKYSMINDGLLTSNTLIQKNNSSFVKPEFLCSVYYLACLIKEIKQQISSILKTSEIKYSFNMGCPIDNFNDTNKGIYDEALTIGYILSDSIGDDGMNFDALYKFYQENKNLKLGNLQTVPELYAEALWFVEQPSTGEGLYTILDIGGGTVDFATIYVSRTNEGEKKTTIYSQNVMPLGVEILLQYMYPTDYKTKINECIRCLKNDSVSMPYGWTQEERKKDRKLSKVIEFNTKFSREIMNVKDRNPDLMNEQNLSRQQIPYYSFGGGADFNWYHSIISSQKKAFERANISPLTRQEVILKDIPDNRLIIAEQLTRSSFPEIDGFPWHFPIMPRPCPHPDARFYLDDIQKEKYGD